MAQFNWDGAYVFGWPFFIFPRSTKQVFKKTLELLPFSGSYKGKQLWLPLEGPSGPMFEISQKVYSEIYIRRLYLDSMSDTFSFKYLVLFYFCPFFCVKHRKANVRILIILFLFSFSVVGRNKESCDGVGLEVEVGGVVISNLYVLTVYKCFKLCTCTTPKLGLLIEIGWSLQLRQQIIADFLSSSGTHPLRKLHWQLPTSVK